MRKIKDLIYRMEESQMVKTCCITGHRDMSEEQTEKIRPVLKEKLVKALDDGFVKFISSFTGNVDRAFAEIATGTGGGKWLV